MNYPGYGWGPPQGQGGAYPVFIPTTPVQPPPKRGGRGGRFGRKRVLGSLEDLIEGEVYKALRDKFEGPKKDDSKPKSKLNSADWFFILCGINSITIPLFIILGAKILH